MYTERRDFGEGIDFKALGRHFETRRLALGMRPGELAIAAGLAPTGSRFVSIEGGKVRDFERWGRCHHLDPRSIAHLADVLGITDATVRSVGGWDLAALRARWREESASLSEHERKLDQFMKEQFEKDGRPLPNMMVGPYGWYRRKKEEFVRQWKDAAR